MVPNSGLWFSEPARRCAVCGMLVREDLLPAHTCRKGSIAAKDGGVVL